MLVLDEPLFRALMDGTMPFHEVMNAFGIRVTIANLPPAVYGFTYVSKKGNYHLALNGNINYETQCKVFIHEIKHIINDIPKEGYIIGLDMQHQTFEIEADKVAESCSRYNAKVG
ncbi:hypothetical protein D2962_09655 [Biomaibacter acetigenes]|uniref:ImmA/IrrE family metallo-endopeptidase n=1 Tax=Biomaibacter acetigenes TaxID=2316383 RepID=A0A3G2R5L7_9FIRM|nr:hypothetical protein [Biomaibacter acetigenes]AYO30844.1 hypothetical protein D2962_09655 [Biomaibacter acetigenes]